MPDIEQVGTWLARKGIEVRRFDQPTPTAALAARVLGCSPAEIAKSVLLLVGKEPVLVVAAGDMKVNSSRLKKALGWKGKVRLPGAEEVQMITGYLPGGVCPFLLSAGLPVLVDQSLTRFTTVYPAAGDDHSGVVVSVKQLLELCHGRLADICQPLADK